ncbi:MAG: pyridoxal phosphate-dependent aminotransferase [Nitrospirae bacterium]|nr:pyridoxal phosphate-dependent aminotransferase [Nitrospirota bacterium]MBI3594592.1 pyridoxal phosphate-dependent aminotransferase [Nitrospirota bacterium]
MKLASRLSRIKPSATLAMTVKAKSLASQGIPIIDFGVGEPDFDTPDLIKESGIEAIRSGFTKYTPPGGMEALKSAILQKIYEEKNLSYEKNEVIVSCGAKHSLYNIAQALFEKEDEVIIPAPYWVSYPDQIMINEGTAVIVPTREENGFILEAAELEKAITSKTKAVILNTPSNPTGAAYSKKNLEEVAEIVLKHKILVIFDEIYEKIVYDGYKHFNIVSLCPELKSLTLSVSGVSKAYSMTGWRIGYTVGPKEIIKAMEMIQGQSTSNPTSISQKASITALESGDPFTEKMVVEFDRRRKFIVERLNKIKGVSCFLPKGAFYAFPNISSYFGKMGPAGIIKDSIDLSTYLLETAHVAVVAGEPFGDDRYIRLSYATGIDRIKMGLDQIEGALQKLK